MKPDRVVEYRDYKIRVSVFGSTGHHRATYEIERPDGIMHSTGTVVGGFMTASEAIEGAIDSAELSIDRHG